MNIDCKSRMEAERGFDLYFSWFLSCVSCWEGLPSVEERLKHKSPVDAIIKLQLINIAFVKFVIWRVFPIAQIFNS